jgi:haloacetate dehalogenase
VIFDGFALERVDVGSGIRLRVRHGGSGPVVVLLHGHPRSHTTWWQVAPPLAEHFTVVCPDLPGYGESTGPPTTADHSPYSKRAMAASIAKLMGQLGHDAYAVAGHDRGAYVAHRLALDFADRVRKLVIMDAVPIGAALARVDAHFAATWWHWFFLAQTAKPAERIINADPDAWYSAEPETLAKTMGQENYEDYRRAIHSPATVHAMCEDYRAGLGIDRAADDADQAAGQRVTCPTLLLWSSRDDLEKLYGDPLAIWHDWADNISGHPIDSDHHMAEDNPSQLVDALRRFLITPRAG